MNIQLTDELKRALLSSLFDCDSDSLKLKGSMAKEGGDTYVKYDELHLAPHGKNGIRVKFVYRNIPVGYLDVKGIDLRRDSLTLQSLKGMFQVTLDRVDDEP